MRVTNSFFNARDSASFPLRHNAVFLMPSKGYAHRGFVFAEYESARCAIKNSFATENWDGYGALPIRHETKENALTVLSNLEHLTCAPEITPNPNGTLTLAWETSKGFGQLEVGRTRYSFCLQTTAGQPITTNGDVGDVNPAVGCLVDALLYPKPSKPVSSVVR